MTRKDKLFLVVIFLVFLVINVAQIHCEDIQRYTCEQVSSKGISPYWNLYVDGKLQKEKYQKLDGCLDKVKKIIKESEKKARKLPVKRV